MYGNSAEIGENCMDFEFMTLEGVKALLVTMVNLKASDEDLQRIIYYSADLMDLQKSIRANSVEQIVAKYMGPRSK